MSGIRGKPSIIYKFVIVLFANLRALHGWRSFQQPWHYVEGCLIAKVDLKSSHRILHKKFGCK
ncbi:hypothetical protein [Gloeobacter violaceus]|uniref:Gsr1564 protein n=1 Tax=Gloeobacter violaceus (strain ATCC 29082 / PCC 7421) TaxID=251221 RepID=Q7NKB4_GLOVI|nr:hypothetical protein [Gloeobacter violaceus]BAC89505.1 gsr1564 [Gloeobacter violaceus PCC 7421]